jgi:hypothetical protein
LYNPCVKESELLPGTVGPTVHPSDRNLFADHDMPDSVFRLHPGLVRHLAAIAFWLGLATALAAARAADEPMVSPDQAAFFETRVRPVFVETCGKCHGVKKQSGGLRLDQRRAILEGGENGPAVVPGDPEKSLLVQAVRRTHEDIKMPPKERLPGPEVEAIAAWVKMGAPWPADTSPGSSASNTNDAAVNHWAFQPVKRVAPPAVTNGGWVRTPVDSFILARLDEAGLKPSPQADRLTLIRRLTFDLTGLPPTATEVASFVKDDSRDAYERLVERLLASPRYGERWGRHWLDVARYADTKGYVFTQERRFPYSYTYRDYVIRAFNEDKPYDEFIVEQLAADRLGSGRDPRSLSALGFLTLGRRFLNVQEDIIDDRIDVVGRGLLGLTIGCARCHDHKFDPIPTDDYYSLFGVFASSVEPAELPEIPTEFPPELIADFRRKQQESQKVVDDFLDRCREKLQSDLRERPAAYLRAAVDLGFDARNPRLDDRARADRLPPGRLQFVIQRWKAKLEATRGGHDPIFEPWHAFAALDPADFARKSPAVAKSLSSADDAMAINPVLTRSFAEKPPASMADVAGRYGELLAEADKRWREGEKTGANSLTDPGWEALRLVVRGEGGTLFVGNGPLGRALDRGERDKLTALQNAVASVRATHPGSPPRAMVLNDAFEPVEPHVLVRGNPSRPGKQVPRQFLAVLSGPARKPFKDGSGRLELARAIASADNPLSARVMVNRVWLHHFGAGLVGTPSDFGLRSDPPTHPKLLDWLADDFVRHGWSIKHLHRRIVLSSTYRQRSENRPEALARDSENRFYWKFNRQRLDFEALRDALLATAGTLDPAMGGRAVSLAGSGPPFRARRTVYGFIDRQNLEPLYRTFDFASPDTSSPRRYVTTVPQQALFLMNSPFVIEQARRLAALPELKESEPAERVRRNYLRLFGREPDERELALGTQFIEERERLRPPTSGSLGNGLTPWEEFSQVLLLTNEFAFVD